MKGSSGQFRLFVQIFPQWIQPNNRTTDATGAVNHLDVTSVITTQSHAAVFSNNTMTLTHRASQSEKRTIRTHRQTALFERKCQGQIVCADERFQRVEEIPGKMVPFCFWPANDKVKTVCTTLSPETNDKTLEDLQRSLKLDPPVPSWISKRTSCLAQPFHPPPPPNGHLPVACQDR